MRRDIKLHPRVRQTLKAKLGGKTPARIAKRARALLLLHEGLSVETIAERVGCGSATVKRVRRRYESGGWERAISDGARPGRPKKLSDQEERGVIALACTDPPDGAARWTVRLLMKHSGHKIGFGIVQRILQEDGLKPWREKNVVRTDAGRRVQRAHV